MIRNIENAILVTRILADNGLGGNSLTRAATAIVALGDLPVVPLAQWEKELLGSDFQVKEWCRLNIESYMTGRDPRTARKIMMIKDCKAVFSLGLKEAKDFVDQAFTNFDLVLLRERLNGN